MSRQALIEDGLIDDPVFVPSDRYKENIENPKCGVAQPVNLLWQQHL